MPTPTPPTPAARRAARAIVARIIEEMPAAAPRDNDGLARIIDEEMPAHDPAELDDQAFCRWWRDEGSGIPPRNGQEYVCHVEDMCRVAWHNGAYKVRQKMPSAALVTALEGIAGMDGMTLLGPDSAHHMGPDAPRLYERGAAAAFAQAADLARAALKLAEKISLDTTDQID